MNIWLATFLLITCTVLAIICGVGAVATHNHAKRDRFYDEDDTMMRRAKYWFLFATVNFAGGAFALIYYFPNP